MPRIKTAVFLIVSLCILFTGCGGDPRVVSRKYVDRANTYFEHGKYKEASLLYRRALSKDPKYADAWYRLGLTNSKLAQLGEARKDFARARDLEPSDTAAMVKLGELDLLFYAADAHGNKELLVELKDLTGRLLKRDQRSFDGLRFKAEIALIEKDRKAAIEEFQKANQVRPDQPELVLAWAQTLYANRQRELGEGVAKDFLTRQKSYGPMYDLLYVDYLKARQLDAAEEILEKKIENNPGAGEYVMQLAYHYQMTGRHAEMQATLDRLTSDISKYPEARLQVGNFLVKIGDFERAMEQYRLGEREKPKRSRLYQKKIIELLASEGKDDEARRVLAMLMRDDPKDPEVVALNATLLLAEGKKRDVKRVIAELSPLAAKLPANAVLHYNLGSAYAASEDQQERGQARMQFYQALKADSRYVPAGIALAELELSEGHDAQAVQYAEEALRIEPVNLKARLVRARGLIKMAEYDQARDELTAAMAMFPKSRDALFELGELDLKGGRIAPAETEFQQLADSDDPRGVAGLIRCKVGAGHFDQALSLAEETLNKHPDRADLRRILADLLVQTGRYAEAAREIQGLIERESRPEALYLKLGELKVHAGDTDAAIRAFEQARALAPNDASPDVLLAMLDERTGKFAEARAAYAEAIQKQPENAVALNNLAYLEADQSGNLDQALAYAQKARAKSPADPNVTDTLGFIYLKKNLNEDGLRLLREAVALKGDSATLHLHLALAWYQKGDRAAARKELDAARRSRPTERDRGEIRQLSAKVG